MPIVSKVQRKCAVKEGDSHFLALLLRCFLIPTLPLLKELPAKHSRTNTCWSYCSMNGNDSFGSRWIWILQVSFRAALGMRRMLNLS